MPAGRQTGGHVLRCRLHPRARARHAAGGGGEDRHRSLGDALHRLALERHLRKLLIEDATATEETEYGQKFEIRGLMTGPYGRSAAVITAWIVLHGEEVARFVSAYPED